MADYILFFLIIPILFAVIGAVTAYIGVRDLIRAKASVAWPTSPGKVLSSSVVQECDSDGHLTYHAEVVYEFNVNNTTFSGKHISYGDYGTSNPSLRAQEIVNCHPQDKNVTVSYMPNNPKECLLEVGVKGHAFLKLTLTLTLMMMMMMMMMTIIMIKAVRWSR